jgi:hypothetical protein
MMVLCLGTLPCIYAEISTLRCWCVEKTNLGFWRSAIWGSEVSWSSGHLVARDGVLNFL